MVRTSLIAGAVMLLGLVGQAGDNLPAARAQINSIIANPSSATAVMKGLSAAEQKAFLGELNAAVSKLPGSAAERTAKFLNVNHAAVKGAQKGNVGSLIAETYATVPVEVLPVICERFASDLINRKGDPNATYTDAQFEDISRDLMKKVNDRVADVDHGEVRGAFAIVMLVKASNGTPKDLMEKLIATLPESAREIARTEWMPSALALDGHTQSYEPLLASADAGRCPDMQFVLFCAGPQNRDALLFDLSGKSTDRVASSRVRNPVLDAVENVMGAQIPAMGGDVSSMGMSASPKGGDVEPGVYQWTGYRSVK